MSCSFLEHFSPLEDPRIERKKLHMLIDILVLTYAQPSVVPRVGHKLKNLVTASWIGCVALFH